MNKATESSEKYDVEKDQDLERGEPEFRKENIEVIFRAGQSKRVWNELYKVGIFYLLLDKFLDFINIFL